MNNLIITQVTPKNQPSLSSSPLPKGEGPGVRVKRPYCYRIRKAMPVEYDPGRRLIAAVLLVAVTDHLWPRRDLSLTHRQSAAEFLASEDATRIIDALDLPIDKAQHFLPLLPPQEVGL